MIYLASVKGHGKGQPCVGQLERIHLQLPSPARSKATMQPPRRRERRQKHFEKVVLRIALNSEVDYLHACGLKAPCLPLV